MTRLSLGKLLQSRDSRLTHSFTWMSSYIQILTTPTENLSSPELPLAPRQFHENDEALSNLVLQLSLSVEPRATDELNTMLRGIRSSAALGLPQSLAQLLRFFDPPIDAALLSRWEMLPAGNPCELQTWKQRYDLFAVKAPVDVEFDTYWRGGMNRTLSAAQVNRTPWQLEQRQRRGVGRDA